MISPIIALILVLVAYMVVDIINPLVAEVGIFVYFLFAYSNIEGSVQLAVFYLFAILFVIAVRVAKGSFSVQSEKIQQIPGVKETEVKGKIPYLEIILAIAIFGVMRLLQGTTSGAIIGTPELAISSAALSVTSIALLGIVETKFLLTLMKLMVENINLVSSIPVIGVFVGIFSLVLPFIAIGLLFATFHLAAFSGVVSSLFFAFLVMIIWIISFEVTGSDRPANLSHGLWNGTVALSRVVSIAGG